MNRLEELSANKFAVVLCCHSDLKKTILINTEKSLDTWKKVNKWKCKVQNHLSLILKDISSLLRCKIPKDLINLIGIQIIKWSKFHENKFGLSISYVKIFLKAKHFMENGVIDREIAARELVEDTNLNISVRLKISHFYFLTDVLSGRKLSVNKGRENLEKDVISNGDEHLPQCVNYLAKGIEHFPSCEDLQSFYSGLFEIALNRHSEVAAKHCWSKVGTSKREHLSKFAIKSLVQKISNISCLLPKSNAYDPEVYLYFEPYVEMIKFIYLELETEQFKQSFHQFEITVVLECVLHWPYHQLFIDIANLLWDMLDGSSYYNLLHMIIYKMNNKILYGRHNYKLLFRKFWIQSPNDLKSYVIRVECSNEDDYLEIDYEYDYLISTLFNLKELTDFDIETVQMILGNCTHDEKLGIVREQGIFICHSALQKGNFKLAELFISSCLSDDAGKHFKRNLLSAANFGYLFWKLISRKKLKLAKKIYVWALHSEEIEVFKQGLLDFLSLEEVLDYFYKKPSIVKNIDIFLKWILSPDQAVQFKKNLVANTEDFIALFMHSLTNGEFEIIDTFLQWIFQTEIEINSYKTNLAFIAIEYPFCIDLRMGLDRVKKFIDWSKLNEFQRRDFKCEFAFAQSTLTYFRDFIDECNLLPIDLFIDWTAMSDYSMKEFKKQLMIYDHNTRIIALYSDLILCGRHQEVDFVIEWSRLSGEHLNDFRRKIKGFCQRNIFVKNIDLRKAETREQILSLLKWSQSSTESIKNILRKIKIALCKIEIHFPVEDLECVETIFETFSVGGEGDY